MSKRQETSRGLARPTKDKAANLQRSRSMDFELTQFSVIPRDLGVAKLFHLKDSESICLILRHTLTYFDSDAQLIA